MTKTALVFILCCIAAKAQVRHIRSPPPGFAASHLTPEKQTSQRKTLQRSQSLPPKYESITDIIGNPSVVAPLLGGTSRSSSDLSQMETNQWPQKKALHDRAVERQIINMLIDQDRPALPLISTVDRLKQNKVERPISPGGREASPPRSGSGPVPILVNKPPPSPPTRQPSPKRIYATSPQRERPSFYLTPYQDLQRPSEPPYIPRFPYPTARPTYRPPYRPRYRPPYRPTYRPRWMR